MHRPGALRVVTAAGGHQPGGENAAVRILDTDFRSKTRVMPGRVEDVDAQAAPLDRIRQRISEQEVAAARGVAARDVEIEPTVAIEVDELRAVIAEIERAVFRQHVHESFGAVVAE